MSRGLLKVGRKSAHQPKTHRPAWWVACTDITRASRLWWEGMSPDKFRELLQSKGARVECPVCGADDWRGLDDIIDLPVRVAGATPHEAHVRIPGFEALAPSCGRCGHVRLIDLRLFEAPAHQEAETNEDRTPREDVELPDGGQVGRSGRRGEPVTNIWGKPVSKRRGPKQ
jgi:hypothetical protein